MTAESEKIFTQMLEEAGVPVTEQEMKDRWNALNKEQGGLIQNDSKWSPFWRLITSIITKPCADLVKLLVKHALPNIFLKYSTSTWLDIYAWGVDVERKKGVAAQGFLLVTRTVSTGELLFPAGTIIETAPINGYVFRLTTTADTIIPDGSLTGNAPVQAEKEGNAFNLGPGYYSVLPTPLAGVASVKNEGDWLDVAGADPEQDEPLRLRCRNQFSAVGQYHHDAAYRADITGFAGIRPDYLFFEHGGPRGPGTANCFVMIESGAPTQSFIDQINSHVRDTGNHGHGDDMLCFPIPKQELGLGVTVHPQPHLTDEQKNALRDGVENMIRCAFRENTTYTVTKTFPQSRFSFSKLSDELHGNFPNLKSVEFNKQDITSATTLPILRSLTVTLGAE